MRAVLIVPENERAGLIGKPLINNGGMVSAMKGTSLARDKYSFVNMKNISLKLKEAQDALTQANITLDKTDETLEIIHNQQSAVSNETNLRYLLSSKYWARWDANAISNKYEQVRFWATAMANDKIRDSLMGETIDVANLTPNGLYKGVMIPRGFYNLGSQNNVRSNDLYWAGVNNIGNSLWDGGFTAQIASIVGYQPNTHAFYGPLNRKPDTASHPTTGFNVPAVSMNVLFNYDFLMAFVGQQRLGGDTGIFYTTCAAVYNWNGAQRTTLLSVPWEVYEQKVGLIRKKFCRPVSFSSSTFAIVNSDPQSWPFASVGISFSADPYYGQTIASVYDLPINYTNRYLNLTYCNPTSRVDVYVNSDYGGATVPSFQITVQPFTIGTPQTLSNDFITQSYYTYNENVFGIDPILIGSRQIVQTNIIKTRVTFPQGLYLCNTVTVKCNDGGTYLLMEREAVQYYSGSGADVSQIEQIIYNFNPKGTGGNFFTTDFRGKIHEVWYTTRDGHTVSYRPNLTYRDNYLGDTFINRTVTYDEFTNYG